MRYFSRGLFEKGYSPDLLFRVLSGSPRSAAILRDLGSCGRQSLSKKLQRGEPLRNCRRARGDGELPLKYFIEVLSNRDATEKPSLAELLEAVATVESLRAMAVQCRDLRKTCDG